MDQVGTEQERKKEEEGFEGRSSSDGQGKRDSEGRMSRIMTQLLRTGNGLINSIQMGSLELRTGVT